MWEFITDPFSMDLMRKAIWVSGIVGGTCAFLSAYLMLKGWSLMGDALSHSVVPGVAGAYALGLPYSVGAFFSGLLAALSITIIRHFTYLKEDAIIGFIFSTFFAVGLFIVSISPMPIDVNSIIFGNILAIADSDVLQVNIIIGVSLIVLLLFWKDLLTVFFDETHARSIGMSPLWLKILFFTLLSACTIAALQTVGAILVIAMVITPGATAYLLSDRFSRVIILSVIIGFSSSVIGAWASYHLDVSPGGIIVVLQTSLFLLAFLFAPKYGYIATRLKIRREVAQ